jgi:hypothetical protein
MRLGPLSDLIQIALGRMARVLFTVVSLAAKCVSDSLTVYGLSCAYCRPTYNKSESENELVAVLTSVFSRKADRPIVRSIFPEWI